MRRGPIQGLSPRVRGNRTESRQTEPTIGSIPARAGEPWYYVSIPLLSEVYPRACGGTRYVRATDAVVIRSIPARAGEPWPGIGKRRYSRVYPRACGGTSWRSRQTRIRSGLSPRVRGNHTQGGNANWYERSIPARAGEPCLSRGRSAPRRVYPRACGGTSPGRPLPQSPAGLSPRVRGNR